ncbi:GIP [Symbiodinium sp. CCMP2456]|nr:GIP [Symbiodinium sp. CCMP2456]
MGGQERFEHRQALEGLHGLGGLGRCGTCGEGAREPPKRCRSADACELGSGTIMQGLPGARCEGREGAQESPPTDHEAGGARPSLPAPTPERRTEAPVAQDDFGSPAESEAEERLKAAMKGGDAEKLSLAIQAAKAAKVRAEVLVEAHEALLRLHKDSTKSATSAMASLRRPLNMDRSDIPAGIRICEALDEIYECFQTSKDATGDKLLKACCEEARQPAAHTRLKQSVFGLLEPEEIKEFLLAPDHQMWMEIKERTERFLHLLDEPGIRVPWKVQSITPESGCHVLRTLRPVIMDQTIREPATNTPFGHTGFMKYLTLQIIRRMGFNDIAITGQYYASSYTPETQILEWMKYNGDSMDGMVAMFGPGDRVAGIHAIRNFDIPNAFLDLTLKASIRFKDANFVESVLEAVNELDRIFREMKLPEDPWRSDAEVNGGVGGKGEISLNLVDLMEFLDLQPGETLEEEKKPQQLRAEEAFARWKKSDAFRRRVVAILTEEGRGCANYTDYGVITRWLRKHFPEKEKYRILIHAHAGDGNTQDAAGIEAALNGANGVWSAVIPQAAQGGHNSSLVFLDNMFQLGNENVLKDLAIPSIPMCSLHLLPKLQHLRHPW